MKEELADECNYAREASFLKKFGEPSLLGTDPRFKVPWVWEGSTQRVLVMEMVGGVSVGGNVIEGMLQEDRNEVGISSERISWITYASLDCHADHRPLPERAVRLSGNAN